LNLDHLGEKFVVRRAKAYHFRFAGGLSKRWRRFDPADYRVGIFGQTLAYRLRRLGSFYWWGDRFGFNDLGIVQLVVQTLENPRSCQQLLKRGVI
jgi:hypothetical protein